jgi:nicotinamide-nucleotide amidase
MNKQMHNSLYELLKAHQYKLVTAESCTGGLLAAAITSLPGSSLWFDRGFVTYSNLSKQQQLLVKPQTLEHYGAVSEQTAREMAEGALKNSNAHISLSVTGIAGPDGGSTDKPVGTVWFAWASSDIFETFAKVHYFKGDRSEIRRQATDFALVTLYEILHAIPQ